ASGLGPLDCCGQEELDSCGAAKRKLVLQQQQLQQPQQQQQQQQTQHQKQQQQQQLQQPPDSPQCDLLGSKDWASGASLGEPPAESFEQGTSTGSTGAPSSARALLSELRVLEAASRLGQDGDDADEDLRKEIELQLQALSGALMSLGNHPGLRAAGSAAPDAATESPEELLGVDVPSSPVSARIKRSLSAASFPLSARKRDLLEVNFELDDLGRKVAAELEFFPDGTVSLQWTAYELPVPLPYVLCLVHEIDLLGQVAPFIVSSGVLHQFPWNDADRLVRVVSKPPIPFVPGLAAIAQRFGFDLLDTPWEAFCLVEEGPTWEAGQWRGISRPPPYQSGLKEVEVKSVAALGRPAGPSGDLTTVIFAGKGDLKVPRGMLPNWLVSWLLKTIGRFIYQRALEAVAKFDTSEYGPRLQNSSFYVGLHRRIAEFTQRKAAAAAAQSRSGGNAAQAT
ncbi:unnamed protein product, partial [Polarella glacialis]